MLSIFKHLWLGLILIAAGSAVLLLSDLDRRGRTRQPGARSSALAVKSSHGTGSQAPKTVDELPIELAKQGAEALLAFSTQAHGKGHEIAVDLAATGRLGIELPQEFLRSVDIFRHVCVRLGRPARITLVNLVETPILASAEQGFLDGLRESGLVEGTDFVARRFNAQGELGQLPAIIDAALATQPDLVLTVTTPALLAAARKVTQVPLLFTVASEPAKLGLFAKGRPANLTGVHDDPPVDKLLDMARRHQEGLRVIGTLYDPAQPNSLISVEKLRLACRERGVKLLEATASSAPEVSAAAQSLVQRGAEAVLLSADNLVYIGFPAILKATQAAGVPIFTTDPKLVDSGALGAIGDDFGAWGAQTGRLAAKVLAGASPAGLPIRATQVQETIEPAPATRK